MNFSEYLNSKKIDEAAFARAEAHLYEEWKREFAQMHPNSFTVQKLNLINPLRRRFTLKTVALENGPVPEPPTQAPKPALSSAPKISKPIVKPKPKTD